MRWCVREKGYCRGARELAATVGYLEGKGKKPMGLANNVSIRNLPVRFDEDPFGLVAIHCKEAVAHLVRTDLMRQKGITAARAVAARSNVGLCSREISRCLLGLNKKITFVKKLT